jgi:polyisoprenoid-binding protein YceI
MSDQVVTITAAEHGPPAPAGTWRVDPDHSRVGFAVRHTGIATIRGQFTEFDGTLELTGDLSTARAYGSVSVASVFTNQPRRDEHLRSADFFDAAQYPELRFESTRLEAIDDESFRITGNLTMHDVTNEVVLRAVVQGEDIDPFGNDRFGLEVTGELSRSDYGMTYNVPLPGGGVLVSDRVKLALDISAIKQI